MIEYCDNQQAMESTHIESLSLLRDFGLFWFTGIPAQRTEIIDFFELLAQEAINVNQIEQITNKDGLIKIMFTASYTERDTLISYMKKYSLNYAGVDWGFVGPITRVVITGSGIRTHSQIMAAILDSLKVEKISPSMIGSSEMSLSLYVDAKDAESVAEIINRTFVNVSSAHDAKYRISS